MQGKKKGLTQEIELEGWIDMAVIKYYLNIY